MLFSNFIKHLQACFKARQAVPLHYYQVTGGFLYENSKNDFYGFLYICCDDDFSCTSAGRY